MSQGAVQIQKNPSQAPYLVWPVARREFYASISLAMLLPVGWGTIIFGWRMLAVLLVSLGAATLVHAGLSRFTRRGNVLVHVHTVAGVMTLVALSNPQWPGWIVACAAALLPAIAWVLGGPGREWVHPSAALALVMTLGMPAAMAMHNVGEIRNAELGTVFHDAILARNRLFMGDVRDQHPAPLYRWSRSSQLDGDDAMQMQRPDYIAQQALDDVSAQLRNAELTADGGLVPAPKTYQQIHEGLDQVLVAQLPAMDLVLIGAMPGQVGTVCLLGILAGGLYLSYRTILRFRSALMFLVTFVLAELLLTLWPATVHHLGFWGLLSVLDNLGGELLTLWGYSVLGSDMLFAAVFLLALPGTEPLTSRGRRAFLVTAGLAAGFLHRWNLPILPATTILMLLMPARGIFDLAFSRRSWLAR